LVRTDARNFELLR